MKMVEFMRDNVRLLLGFGEESRDGWRWRRGRRWAGFGLWFWLQRRHKVTLEGDLERFWTRRKRRGWFFTQEFVKTDQLATVRDLRRDKIHVQCS